MQQQEMQTSTANAGVERIKPRARRGYWVIKRIFDMIASLGAIVILSPLLLLIAALVFIDDPKGSPIFTQKRVGKNGREFNFYKFRSMCVDAEEKLGELQEKNEMDGPVFKIKDDPRITNIGRFIRKTSIDELPQLFNVLKGDMSIVGPRPAIPREVAKYTDIQRERLLITPGLTCYWQVMPKRNSLSFDEWVELDRKYIRECSLWVDIKLIFKTVGVMLTAQGE